MITKVIAMEKILEQTLLYDFYGELLTEHQRQVYEDVVLLKRIRKILKLSRKNT